MEAFTVKSTTVNYTPKKTTKKTTTTKLPTTKTTTTTTEIPTTTTTFRTLKPSTKDIFPLNNFNPTTTISTTKKDNNKKSITTIKEQQHGMVAITNPSELMRFKDQKLSTTGAVREIELLDTTERQQKQQPPVAQQNFKSAFIAQFLQWLFN